MATPVKPYAHPSSSNIMSQDQQDKCAHGLPMTNAEWANKYIDSFSEKELVAYQIAKSHLGSSFSLEKSKGFIEWKLRVCNIT